MNFDFDSQISDLDRVNRPSALVWIGRHHQHRAMGALGYILGERADEQIVEWAVVMRSHDDQLGIPASAVFQNAVNATVNNLFHHDIDSGRAQCLTIP